ncbi:hypothetical protein C2G38_2116823 [Gigaspora rosea]|uniref:Uncharacterized protein n=1 Tax=Gigaspora rosea TaxID=44941 RepID=A0A397UAK4_9GLOM|nr:hypothetical protein C2G38_2116823 [Gigaspora rosea]
MAIDKKIQEMHETDDSKVDKKIEKTNDLKDDKKKEETNNSKDDNFIYEDKIPFKYLLSAKNKTITNILLCIYFILSIPFLCCIGLVTPGSKNSSNLEFDFKLRRTDIELEGINRLLMGVYTSTNNHNKSESV